MVNNAFYRYPIVPKPPCIVNAVRIDFWWWPMAVSVRFFKKKEGTPRTEDRVQFLGQN